MFNIFQNIYCCIIFIEVLLLNEPNSPQKEGDISTLCLPHTLPPCLRQRGFVINRVILPKGVKGATYVVSMGQRSNTHETQGHGSHASNLAMCQHIDIVR